MLRNWSWILGSKNPIKKVIGGPQLRARSDQGIKWPVSVAFGVGIGYYAFQPSLKEAAGIVAAEKEKKASFNNSK
jgi:hypothetical protein